VSDSELTFSARIGGPGGIKGIVARAQHAEDAGFDQVWSGNDFLGESGIVTLAAIAMSTTRIKFGSGVLDPVSLHPGQVAQITSGLQELSGGRFLLGIGAGSDIYFNNGGIHPPSPVVRTRQGVLAIRALLNGESPAGIDGVADGWQPQGKIHDPIPAPIYIGAMGPKMLALTGRIADGAISLCLPPGHVFGVMERIRQGTEEAGRSLDELDVAAGVWVSVGEDGDEARWVMARQIARYAGSLSFDAIAENGLDVDEFKAAQDLINAEREDDAIRFTLASKTMMRLGIVGGPDEIIDQCGALIEAGVKHVSFGPPLGVDGKAAVEILGKTVFPALRFMFNK